MFPFPRPRCSPLEKVLFSNFHYRVLSHDCPKGAGPLGCTADGSKLSSSFGYCVSLHLLTVRISFMYQEIRKRNWMTIEVRIVGEIKLEYHLFIPVREKHSNIKAICSLKSVLLSDTVIQSQNKLSKNMVRLF